MTTRRDLKKLIRDRMKKTGESYASARRAVQGEFCARQETAAPAIPGWIATGQAPHDYDFKLDERGYRRSSSAMVRARKPQPDGFGTLTQRLVPDDYRGRRVRLSGWIKSEGVTGSCKLWMRVELPDRRVVAFGESPLIRGTTDWAQYQVVLDVDAGAAVLAFGILLQNGAGAAWLSDVSLASVGADVPTSDAIDPPLSHRPRNLAFREGGRAIDEHCDRLRRDSNALVVMLLDARGEPIATAGAEPLLDEQAVRAFCESSGRTVADLVANEEIAGAFGHTAGEQLHVSRVGDRALLAVLFDHRSSLGLVRLRVKRAREQLARLLSEDPTGSGGPASPAAPSSSGGSPAPAQPDDDRDEPR